MQPRFVKPEKGNKYYNRKPSGYNPCIIGNYPYNSDHPTGFPGMNVLCNCTGYGTGRFNEIIGKGNCSYLGKGDAHSYDGYAIKQGLKVGVEPKLGACAVWEDGKYGHIAIVEQIVDKDTIIVSESGWYSKVPFWVAKHTRGNGDWVEGQDYSWMKKYKLKGFIYNPATEVENMTVEELEKLIEKKIWETVPNVIEQIKATTAKLPPDDWAKDAINMNIADGTMVGYEDGFHAQSDIRREEVSQVAANIKAWVKQYLQQISD